MRGGDVLQQNSERWEYVTVRVVLDLRLAHGGDFTSYVKIYSIELQI